MVKGSCGGWSMNGKILKCSRCPYSTPTTSILKRHELTHTDIRNWPCTANALCKFRAKTKGALKEHMTCIHATEKRFKCEMSNCDYATVSKVRLWVHLKRVHSRKGPAGASASSTVEKKYACLVATCQTKCETRTSLKIHMMMHTGERPFACPLCFYRTTTRSHLNRHISHRHTKETPHKCDHCSHSTFNKAALKNHTMIHKGETPFVCDEWDDCDYKCRTRFQLKLHYLQKHLTKKPFKCPHQNCEYSTVTQGQLKKHEKTHQKNLVRPYACPHCDYKSIRRDTLTSHIASRHTRQGTHVCPICHKFRAVIRSSLDRHICTTHGGQKPNPCPFCDMTFLTKTELNTHILTHTGEKPCRCPEEGCSYSGKTNSDLRSHVKRVHLKLRPYPCPFCDYRGFNPSKLKDHENRHKNERPFPCPLCPYRSRDRGDLKIHVGAHKNDKEGARRMLGICHRVRGGRFAGIFVCGVQDCKFSTTRSASGGAELAKHYDKIHQLPMVLITKMSGF